MDEISLAPAAHDPLASRLGYLLRRASLVMMADLGASLADLGLRPVEGSILMLVGATPGCIQSDVGKTLGIKRANMAPLIAGLHAKGLVAKAPVDGRSLALSLTEEGARLRERVETTMDRHEARFDALLGEGDRAQLHAALARIAQQGQDGPDGIVVDGR
ncbi:MarR family winged helix-turn-helix transcriptional regulator [Sphingobium scionense]|jgi:DNA-binding MarR family transcriptional regulator|uniref:DNA-binding MarR family transcriptional regulator n=1 Tax=Sphingobium scionense TaxID=1404341 RepID=A0A7W6LT88_9SPHN|nr:MarR family winged helix-turn-helix transcriptional regulator [Sphingobium scionense]MBB4150048.1 DNA-binding MarR family transcriptional regulator [Sphingobium scionense]